MITDYKSRKNEVLGSHQKVEDLVAEITKCSTHRGSKSPGAFRTTFN